ncbi:MAG: Sulfotransferase family [Rhodobacteraceae bacterium HLUCCA08]|nr:MAG: Sulfotransferase family [Rhodobacteraceae bacterium HLUCCA08]
MIFYERHKVAYVPIPKVACSALKLALHEMEHGVPFARDPDRPRRKTLHQLYPSARFDPAEARRLDGYFSFVVVRDPVERILSAYANKLRQGEIMKRTRSKTLFGLFRADLPTEPTPEEFIDRFEHYRAANTIIRSHTEPTAYFTGPDLGLYSAVFPLNDRQGLRRGLRKWTGKPPVRIPRRNPTDATHKITARDLSRRSLARLIDLMAPDYALLKDFFEPPALGDVPVTRSVAAD